MLYVCIVGGGDVPIFEAELGSTQKVKTEDLNQFIIHAALDIVDHRVWRTDSMFLKEVDKFNDQSISAFVTAGHTRFMLLHDSRGSENQIQSFFSDVHELYLRVLMNPFYERGTAITSRVFDKRVRELAKKYFLRH